MADRPGASVNNQTQVGITPLMYAAEGGNKQVVQLLLDHGANPNKTDNHGRDPLKWARNNGNSAVTSVLRNKVDEKSKPADGTRQHSDQQSDTGQLETNKRTVKYIQALKKKNFDDAEQLLDKGIEVNQLIGRGVTPLMATVRFKQAGHLARRLLDQGADPTITGHRGVTALHFAVNNQSVKLIKQLIEAGADPMAGKAKGPAFIAALRRSDTSVLNYFAKKGIDLDKNYYGTAPLLFAARFGNEQAVEFLINHGVDTSVTSESGKPAYELLNRVNPEGAEKLQSDLKP